MIEKRQEFLANHDDPSAERALRTELSRYIGWVFQHTIAELKHPVGPPFEIIEIDLDALESLAELLAVVLERQGKKEAIIHTFDHIAATVPLPGLEQRMAFLSCLWLTGPLEQPALAEKILAKWTSHEEIEDMLLLQIYLDVRSEALSPAERISLIDRILAAARSENEKLHYSGSKAMLTVLTGEVEQAKRLHEKAMGNHFAAVAERARKGDFCSRWICAQALEVQGVLSNDRKAFERALPFLKQIPLNELTPKGAEEVLYRIGRLHSLAGNDAQAIAYFTDAYSRSASVLPLIYRLQALVRTNELEKAKLDLNTLRGMQIPPEYKLEFLRSASSLAVSGQDLTAARSLAKELKELDLEVMHFCSQRDQLRANLLEFLDEQQSRKDEGSKRSRLQTILHRIQSASQYFELKPNVFGLGLNLNRALERRDKKDDRKG